MSFTQIQQQNASTFVISNHFEFEPTHGKCVPAGYHFYNLYSNHKDLSNHCISPIDMLVECCALGGGGGGGMLCLLTRKTGFENISCSSRKGTIFQEFHVYHIRFARAQDWSPGRNPFILIIRKMMSLASCSSNTLVVVFCRPCCCLCYSYSCRCCHHDHHHHHLMVIISSSFLHL